MKVPFTHEQFVAVFAGYNAAVWPAQLVAYVLGLAACWSIVRGVRGSGPLVAAVLALLWAWTGLAYHVAFFAAINPAARVFGVFFVAQAALFAAAGWTRSLAFERPAGLAARAGWLLVAYAMVLYPLAGLAAGAAYPALPMFGITPCPLTLFTFGALLLAKGRPAWWLLPIPVAWSLVGGSAAFLLDVPQDWPLLVTGLAVLPLLLAKGPRARSG